NGDRRPDFFVAAPRMDVGGSAGQGRVVVFQSHDITPPMTPAVRGPRRPRIGSLSYVLTSQDADNLADELVFLCSFDSPRLHQCANPLRQKLRVGVHVLRVRARDPAGNQSSVSIARISIVR